MIKARGLMLKADFFKKRPPKIRTKPPRAN